MRRLEHEPGAWRMSLKAKAPEFPVDIETEDYTISMSNAEMWVETDEFGGTTFVIRPRWGSQDYLYLVQETRV